MTKDGALAALNHTQLGVLCRCGAGALWVIGGAIAKWATSEGASLAQVVVFRNGVALAAILVVIVATGRLQSLRAPRLWRHFVRGLIGLVWLTAGFAALRFTTLTTVTVLGFTAPLFVTLLSWPLLGQRVGLQQGCATGLGFAGVLLIIGPGATLMANLGGFLALAAALFGALTTMSVVMLGRGERTLPMVFYFLLFITGGALLPLPFFWNPLTGPLWCGLVALGLVSAGAQFLLTRSVREAPPAAIVPFDYTQMIWATLLGWVLWSEHPDTSALMGALTIALAGGWILYLSAGRKGELREG